LRGKKVERLFSLRVSIFNFRGGMTMNILVVDDEKVQLETLRRGLGSKGHVVAEALSAEEALKHLGSDTKIDLVLTDYAMPGMNGIELLRNIRESYGNLPVIMMTAYGEKDLIIDALRNRCDSFIEKPFTLDKLIQEIERAKINIVQNTSTDRLSELIPQFIHQLNNPLTCILATAEFSMLQLNDAETIKECLTDIIKATRNIQTINKELLGLGRTAAKDEIERVDIKALVANCIDMFKDLMSLKGVSIEKDLSGEDLCVLGSKFGLEQLFKNLILNAVDSMDGRPEKLLKIKAEADPNASSVSVYIQDTGCGIPAASVNTIFTPYFTSKKGGTGLGLAVVKRIVEDHRGAIQVRSEEGEGTTFTISLPVNRERN
jgi:signal transduction histidine kinase